MAPAVTVDSVGDGSGGAGWPHAEAMEIPATTNAARTALRAAAAIRTSYMVLIIDHGLRSDSAASASALARSATARNAGHSIVHVVVKTVWWTNAWATIPKGDFAHCCCDVSRCCHS
ncbi:hypothetical protein [Mycobacterium persicum]|uniref:hypothetical protein n=1 Tax=Mycobacterium persicum TaxID=1487726 RepID=UPI001F080906|nr:hypothetical protein [Mycobacterium persicum]